jgi:hypothetical protein
MNPSRLARAVALQSAHDFRRGIPMLRLVTALALLLATTASAHAETLVWRFDFFDQANFSYQWGWMGDDFGPYTGTIVNTKVVFDGYITEGEIDTSQFRFTFDIPSLSDNAWIGLTGESMGWSGSGPVSYVYESDAHNGELREGRFGAEMTSCGEPPCNGMGSFVGEAYIEVTIEGQRADPIFSSNFDDIW